MNTKLALNGVFLQNWNINNSYKTNIYFDKPKKTK